MIKDKKILLTSSILAIIIIIVAISFVFGKTKNRELIQTINKIYYAYSSYILDLGHSPKNIADLYTNQNNIAKWNGPYISKNMLQGYDQNSLQIVQASNIPTKKCSLDSLSYCYNWIKISGLNTNTFNKIKENIPPQADVFYAQNNIFFKLSSVE